MVGNPEVEAPHHCGEMALKRAHHLQRRRNGSLIERQAAYWRRIYRCLPTASNFRSRSVSMAAREGRGVPGTVGNRHWGGFRADGCGWVC